MIRFIGDLSIEDAKTLYQEGIKAKHILEFGVGGSTQLFAQAKPDYLVSVETDPNWIERTRKRLCQLEDITVPLFVGFGEHPKQPYDLIFVDGVIELRYEFAESVWELLSIGGKLMFHDTRREYDFQIVAKLAQLHFNEIDKIDVNINNSNITIITKKRHQPYADWNYTEGKPIWAYGVMPDTDDKPLWPLDI